jgi:DNA-binding MarR family transcriptional regulator
MLQLLYAAGMQKRELRALADELSRCWHDLGRVLTSRRLLAALLAGSAAKLTPTQLRALGALADAASVRIGELAEHVGIDETTATRLVDRLEHMGLVERRDAIGDRRATLVVLTRSGKTVSAEIAAQRQRFFADVLSTLEPEERAELVRLTAKAAEALRTRSEELILR